MIVCIECGIASGTIISSPIVARWICTDCRIKFSKTERYKKAKGAKRYAKK